MLLRGKKYLARGFDIVHFHSFSSLSIGYLMAGRPAGVVFTLHADSANYLASTYGWDSPLHPALLLFRLHERISIRIPDLTIAVAERLVNYGEQIGARKVLYIPNAVDCGFWSPPARAPKGPPRLLVPRMLVPKNGVEYAIKAMKRILRSFPDATMTIAGDGPLRHRLKRIAESECGSSVRFVGVVPRTRLRELYWGSDVTIIPSVTESGLQEATSISAIEAMACSTPVVASDIGGLPELIRHGHDGLLVPERDGIAIADAVVEVLGGDSLRESLRTHARETALARFSLPTWTRQVIAAYHQVLA